VLTKLKKEGKIDNMEVQLRKKSGETFLASISLRIIDIKHEPCVLIVAEDITKLKVVEKKLRGEEAAKNVKIGREEVLHEREQVSKGREKVVGKREEVAKGREEIAGRREKIKVGAGREGIALGREKVVGKREEVAKGREKVVGKREEVETKREKVE
jgi:hypothetical protein